MGERAPKKRILIVEDEPDIVDIYKALLKSKFTLEAVDNYDDGMAFVKKNDICGAIVDILLRGEKTGLDFLASCNGGLPAIVVTALGDGYKTEARKQGAKAYHTKPFNNDELLDDINKYFNPKTLSQRV